MLWIGLHFHRLALDALAPASGRSRLAICDRLQVLHACEAALAAGIAPGMRRAAALALVPDLAIADHDPDRERDALLRLAGWSLQFTPHASLQPPDGVLLEVERGLLPFGSLRGLLQRLRRGLLELRFSAGHAVAPTAAAAWLLARHDSACRRARRAGQRTGRRTAPLADRTSAGVLAARLGALPVTLLESACAHAGTLDGIGVRTIADLLRLPRAGLARRFGTALLDEVDRAHGLRPEPRIWVVAPAEFDGRLELPAPVESAEALLFAARRLLAQLAGWLAARQAATAALVLHVEHDRCLTTSIGLALAGPSRETGRFVALLRERLASMRLAAPARALRLHCSATLPQAPASGTLFAGPAEAREAMAQLVERLRARLGPRRVIRLLTVPDHRPERAWRAEPADASPAGHSAPPVRSARPLWLLRAPLALTERDGHPFLHGRLRLREGPERIESGWWDSHLVQRDYFVAEDEAGACYWVFRIRGGDAAGPVWYLHGRFG